MEPEAPCDKCKCDTLGCPVGYQCSACRVFVCQQCLLKHARDFAPAFTAGVPCPGEGCSKPVYLISDLWLFPGCVSDMIMDHLLHTFKPVWNQIEAVLKEAYQLCMLEVKQVTEHQELLDALELLSPTSPDIPELFIYKLRLRSRLRTVLCDRIIRKHLDTGLGALILRPLAQPQGTSERNSDSKVALATNEGILELEYSERERAKRVTCVFCQTSSTSTAFCKVVCCPKCGRTFELRSFRTIPFGEDHHFFENAESLWIKTPSAKKDMACCAFSDFLQKVSRICPPSERIDLPHAFRNFFSWNFRNMGHSPLPDVPFRIRKFAVEALLTAVIEGADVTDVFTKEFSNCMRDMVSTHVRRMMSLSALHDMAYGTYMFFAQLHDGHNLLDCIARLGILIDRVDVLAYFGRIQWPHHGT